MSDSQFRIASCRHCGQHIEFPAEGAGMLVPCPHCAGETILNEERPATPAAGEEITAAELKAALDGAAPPRRISIFYQAGLFLVAFFMILLPLAYLAFAAFTAYCVYWFAIHGLALFSSSTLTIQLLLVKVLLYIGLLLGGTIAVFFMFKPILARSPKSAPPLQLNPAQHPRLYQFIAHVSDLLRVSMPRRIYLSCDLNARADFRRGWLSFFGNDMVLTLGLPLVSGLNTRQLAAIIAHELGHCTQFFAMRLGRVIDSVDGWFFRVVYERDSWDVSFEEWANSVEDSRLRLIVLCAGLSVWLSRKILTLFMFIGHAASCYLLRQMEFHADACSMAVAGSAGVESAVLRTREQAVIQHLAYTGLDQIWRAQRRLPDSLPDFLEQFEQRLPPGFHDQARLTLLNETCGLFDTHPTSAQRIQKARQRAEPGVFALEKPARALFNDFPATSRLVTSQFYRVDRRMPVTNPMLRPVEEFFRATS
jgi:Zn-dependent protease with chaperone function